MKIKKLKLLWALLLLVFLLPGCFNVDRSFRGMKSLMMLATDNRFEEEFEFSLGTVSLSVAELALNFTDADDSLNKILGEINSVQLGIYNNNSDSLYKPTKKELDFITDKPELCIRNCKHV